MSAELLDDAPDFTVTGAPPAIWLCLGDLSSGAMPGEIAFDECESSGEVTWCNDSQDAWDVKYVRADLTASPDRVRREALASAIVECERVCACYADDVSPTILLAHLRHNLNAAILATKGQS